jgi:hypothetical protein
MEVNSSRFRFGVDGLLPSCGVRVCSLAGQVSNLRLIIYLSGFIGLGPQNLKCPKFAKISSLFRENFAKKRENMVIIPVN